MWDFTVNTNRSAARTAITGEKGLHEFKNSAFEEALANLVAALPEGEGDVKIEVNGDIQSTNDRPSVTVTVSMGNRRDVDRREPEYKDAGRHTHNDKGELTDVNALPVGEKAKR